ncbi:hypothetical protein ES288_D07G223200v1, partial [Gossypium darwinii]
DDPLIISATILPIQVSRILVDIRSSVDFLTVKAFHKMGFKETTLTKASPVYGFANQPITIKGSIIDRLLLGDGEHIVLDMVKFLVVDHLTAYNVIFGKPIMWMVEMAVDIFCIMVKFPTLIREEYLKCD